MAFVRAVKDREKSFFLHLPDQMTLNQTESIEPTKYQNAEIKDMRIEEKRSFELENCKVKAQEDGAKMEGKTQSGEMKIKLNNLIFKAANQFVEESEVAEGINVFEVSNSQLF